MGKFALLVPRGLGLTSRNLSSNSGNLTRLCDAVASVAIHLSRSLPREALGIERQEADQDLLVSSIAWPAVGSEDRFIELAVRVLQPGGIFVVEVGECELLEFWRLTRVRRIEPGVALGDSDTEVGIDRATLAWAPVLRDGESCL